MAAQSYSQTESYQAHKSLFLEFLDLKFPETGNDYHEKIRLMVEEGSSRLIVNLNDFISFDRQRRHIVKLMKEPHLYIPAFEEAIKSYIETYPSLYSTFEEYHVGFTGSFGAQKLSPRQINSSHLLSLICIEGIVTKVSLVRPKLVQSIQYCPATQKSYARYHRDSTTLFGLPTAPIYPKTDESGNLLQTEFGLCVFKDYQTLQLQEMPERAPPGQMPRSVEVIVENDLVDQVKPGDRVRITGIYRAIADMFTAQKTKGIFQTLVLANYIQMFNDHIQGPAITADDIRNIRSLAKETDIFFIISNSLAPSIYGHSYIKKAILLQLLGGNEKELDSSGIRLRGDINILMVGDPGTAKSQFLRFVMHVAPLCISTTGRGASGVGLTAAVVQDKETGERRLEAGAMVLADRGIACIDEFDKMTVEDRVSIHEVMEQQTVTIAKAGIHTSLNARCSVLGAANPIYGKYDRNKSATQNIALPDSLLSRFDLLFIILDTMDPSGDRNIAEHVLRMHQYHSNRSNIIKGSGGGGSNFNPSSSTMALGSSDEINELGDVSQEEHHHDQSGYQDHPHGGDFQANEHQMASSDPGSLSTTSIYAPYDRLLHLNRKHRLLNIAFIKKYLLYCKLRVHPVLTEVAQNKIIDAYDDLRRMENTKTSPVTARTLETMIRLTIAHAKCRLSREANIEDVDAALDVLRYALYNDSIGNTEVESDPSKKDASSMENDPMKSKQILSKSIHNAETLHSEQVDHQNQSINKAEKMKGQGGADEIQGSIQNVSQSRKNPAMEIVQEQAELSTRDAKMIKDDQKETIANNREYSAGRKKMVEQCIVQWFNDKDQISLDELISSLASSTSNLNNSSTGKIDGNSNGRDQDWHRSEVESILSKMEEQGKLMLTDDQIIKM